LAVLSISGEHDLNTAPELRSQLDRLIDDQQPVLVDMSPASFIDSSVLGVVLAGRRRALEAGTGFVVVHSPSEGTDAVARVLEITGLRDELPVYEDREAAAAQATAGKPDGG
jgi:anti-sigma B factor antagonist